ncbi:MAG: FtsX-like permease family protein, partial [Bryobacterales bacterium]|nr:FtsX-like permease family protein [Bryobacterales bacterium]
EMYLPLRQTNDYSLLELVARGSRSPSDLASAMRSVILPLDPTIPANEFRTIQDLVDRSVSPRRFLLLLLTGFAAFALLLSGLGVYAVVSYSVLQRRQEIGIRMALGASAGDVRKEVLLQTLKLAAVGITLGVVAAAVLSRLIRGLLYEVTPNDPVTYAAMLAILATAAILAGYIPARRASQLDPMAALRSE